MHQGCYRHISPFFVTSDLYRLSDTLTRLGHDKVDSGTDTIVRHVRSMVTANCKLPTANTVLSIADRFDPVFWNPVDRCAVERVANSNNGLNTE
jgi:hypothetical protein